MKPRILFVDDDSKVLDAIRRSLRGVTDDWQMEFASSGADALQMLASHPVDVIVSDIKMPEMSGIELLGKVREMYPEVIRIVLSGHYTEDQAVDGVSGEHKVLSKPCDKDVLIATITGTLETRNLVMNPGTATDEELASGLEELTESLRENGYVSAFEVPVHLENEAARQALEALIPQSGRLLRETGEMSVFLRIELGDKSSTRRPVTRGRGQ